MRSSPVPIATLLTRTGLGLALTFLLLGTGAGTALAQGGPASLQEIQLTGSFGLDYSNGGYGTNQNTNVLLGLFGLGLETDSFRVTASMPYMRISGRGLVVFDAGGNAIVVNRRGSTASDVRTGFGDLNLSAS